MAFIYFERAGLRSLEYTSERLFQAICLALATEEDSPEGLDEITGYFIGFSTSNMNHFDHLYVRVKTIWSDHKQWRKALRTFNAGRDTFWKRLNYRTLVTKEEVLNTIQSFKNFLLFKHPRTPRTLQLFYPFE